MNDENYFKIITTCPSKNVSRLIMVLAKAGAGQVGKYTHCVHITAGEGTWLPLPGAKPAIGKIGKLSRVKEMQLETVCVQSKLAKALKALKAAHPYETPVIQVIQLFQLVF